MNPSAYRLTGAVLLAELLLLVVPNFVLEAVFEFPDILRQPAEDVLTLFRENQATIVPTYYAFAMSGVLFAVVALLLRHALKTERTSVLLQVATLFGVLTAVVQFLVLSAGRFWYPNLSASTSTRPRARPPGPPFWSFMKRLTATPGSPSARTWASSLPASGSCW